MSASATTPEPWPTAISLNPEKNTLSVVFDTGEIFNLEAELLRVESPSAEVQGHSASQKTTPAGKRKVKITDIKQVGHYAIRLVFSDGHDSGLFTWTTLHRYGRDRDDLMARYLARLEEQGLSRDG
ncbi:gamma-butyrobetaine hydroxylase-like domain-containing protein [Alphaproteobacteria bacterium LSUCC0684]